MLALGKHQVLVFRTNRRGGRGVAAGTAGWCQASRATPLSARRKAGGRKAIAPDERVQIFGAGDLGHGLDPDRAHQAAGSVSRSTERRGTVRTSLPRTRRRTISRRTGRNRTPSLPAARPTRSRRSHEMPPRPSLVTGRPARPAGPPPRAPPRHGPTWRPRATNPRMPRRKLPRAPSRPERPGSLPRRNAMAARHVAP
jgi:hypothetical protein